MELLAVVGRIRRALPSLAVAAAVIALGATVAAAQPAGAKPNIVIIWGDDIGQSNISAYSHGVMGYTTLNKSREVA